MEAESRFSGLPWGIQSPAWLECAGDFFLLEGRAGLDILRSYF